MHIMGHLFSAEAAQKIEGYIKEKTNVDVKMVSNREYVQYIPYFLESKLEYTKQGEFFSGHTEVELFISGKRDKIREAGITVCLHYLTSERKNNEVWVFYFSTNGECVKETYRE